jgi:hypothetical protein
VTVLAISMDAPDDSRVFARDYGIEFPLLADEDGAVARVYAGVTSDHNALPGITIIRPDGHIVFRQIASAKDDRMSSAELLAAIDRTLGTTGPAPEVSGYAALARAQLRLDVGGGAIRDEGWRATANAAVSGLVPLGRHVLAGIQLGFEPREAPLSMDGVVVLREPIFGPAGALELGLVGGYTPWNASGADLGAFGGMWFAMAPTWSLQLHGGLEEHGDATELLFTIGIARLIQIR